MHFSLNIKTRLALWYLLILAIILMVFSLLTYFMLARSLYNIAQETSKLTIIQPENAPLNTNQKDLSAQPNLFFTYTISAERLEKLKSEPSSILSIDTLQGQIVINQKDFITADMVGEQRVQLFLRSSVNIPGSYEILAITQPVSEVSQALAAFTRGLYFVIPITAVLAAGFGFLLIWRMLRPVSMIAKTARDIEEKDLSQRIEIQNNDELGKLAATLNQTFARLQKAFQRERQFTSDASHELRTPLAIMQSEATLALKKERNQEEYQKSLIVISQEISHMSTIINKLLTLSRMDNSKDNLNLTIINMSELLSDLASDMEALCEDKSLHFNQHFTDGIQISGDRIRLRELFLNLLDNAVKYTPSGGSINLSLSKNGDQALISVSDTGIGIPAEHLPHIFERFYRVNKTSSPENDGSGLGLAICKQIAEIHGGKITVESRMGEGSTFTVLLPLIKE